MRHALAFWDALGYFYRSCYSECIKYKVYFRSLLLLLSFGLAASIDLPRLRHKIIRRKQY